MSPFASFLRELRQRRGLKQKAVADLLGYEQSYLSSLEKGLKGLPRRAFIDRLISCLALNDAELYELERVVKLSNRQVLLPIKASAAEYELWYDLKTFNRYLEPEQIKVIRDMVRLMISRDDMIASVACRDAAPMERGRPK